MASRLIPEVPAKLYLGEWIAIRSPGGEPDIGAFALLIGTDYATVWRWIEGEREPDLSTLKVIADGLRCEIGDLFKPPSEASQPALLAGIPPDGRAEILNHIAYVRSKHEA